MKKNKNKPKKKKKTKNKEHIQIYEMKNFPQLREKLNLQIERTYHVEEKRKWFSNYPHRKSKLSTGRGEGWGVRGEGCWKSAGLRLLYNTEYSVAFTVFWRKECPRIYNHPSCPSRIKTRFSNMLQFRKHSTSEPSWENRRIMKSS